ncbi:MAG: GNAT family N-acetyltransferase [Chloroflexi bacterium]|nr:GNAT family N-acetyltransferase [Chloroflexota bacterium]
MQKQLADGLILRSLSEGCASDRDRLPQFYYDVFVETGTPETEQALFPWTRDLMSGHPTVALDDIFVVVDPAKDDMIVSATLLIPQVWRYEEVELPVGRPEIVATHREYRRRGLVRALFEAVHERSAALGHNVCAITGIAHYYRQFGYTMAVHLGQHATLNAPGIGKPPDERYTLRPATMEDLPDVARWSDYYARTRLLSAVYTPEVWRYELGGRSDGNPWQLQYRVILNSEGQGVGYIALRPHSFDDALTCFAYVVGEAASYLETFPYVVYDIKQWGKARFNKDAAIIDFASGLHETVSTLIDRTLAGLVRRREYAWYLRVVDLVRFMRDIQPVLERRLEGSGAQRYTGALKIGFYNKTGLTLTFERGGLRAVTAGALDERDADISFPWHLFLNVVFGYHTPDEIRAVLPEIWGNEKAAVLLPILFPKKPSWLIGLA